MLAAAAAAALLPTAVRAAKLNDDGLHVQDWFHESFLDLKQDIAEASEAGKRVAITMEQRGCIYCAEMHEKILVLPTVATYIQKHFHVVQLNLFGAREVTDLDGAALTEKDAARKWAVTTTPTIFFLPEKADGRSLKDAASARMRGLLKPSLFLAMFEFVAGRHYQRMEFTAYANAEEPRIARAIAAGATI